MRLADMQRIARDLGSPPGELAPLAGAAGGNWEITVPNQTTTQAVVKTKPGVVVSGALLNLLELDTPTLMTEWHIYNIRIPVALSLTAEAALAAAPILTGTAILRRGGQIVWSQELEQPGSNIDPSANLIFRANLIFNADLQNPIVLNRGRSLTLELRASTSAETKEIVIQTNVQATGTGVVDAGQGVIGYSVRELTGHRAL